MREILGTWNFFLFFKFFANQSAPHESEGLSYDKKGSLRIILCDPLLPGVLDVAFAALVEFWVERLYPIVYHGAGQGTVY